MLIAMPGCKEDRLEPVEKDGKAPEPVRNVKVENLPGSARFTYTLPSDADLLYVKAEFEDGKGKIMSTKASYYTNQLTVKGFGDTAVHQVKLYAVDRSENSSTPVTVSVQPQLPPVLAVFKSLQIKEDFGGVNIQLENASEADIAIVVCATDSLGAFLPVETYYTKLKQVSFSIRGYDAAKKEFGAYIRDRWDNRSDTLRKELVPLFEKQLDKGKFRLVSLPTDQPYAWGLPMTGMWNNVISDGDMFHTAQGSGLPQWFTFDLGVKAKLSRFTLWQRQGSWIYTHGNPKRYELYGSNNPPSDGSWNNWIKLTECASLKPSGLPLGENSNEDVEAAGRGEEWTVPLDAPPVRYIRFKLLENWSGSDFLHVSEITLWGKEE